MPQPENDEARLARFPLLRDAAPAILAEMARHARWRRAQPGETLLDYGDVTDDVLLILSGSVRVALRTPGGQELIVGDREAGEVVGEMAAIDGDTRSANVTALHATTLCALPGAAFLKGVLASPPVALRVMRLLTARLRLEDSRLMELAVLPVRYRLYAELLRLARVRDDSQMRISPPPPQHILASRIGARREAVSREMSVMSRTGLAVVTRQSISLLDPPKLRRMINAALAGDEEAKVR